MMASFPKDFIPSSLLACRECHHGSLKYESEVRWSEIGYSVPRAVTRCEDRAVGGMVHHPKTSYHLVAAILPYHSSYLLFEHVFISLAHQTSTPESRFVGGGSEGCTHVHFSFLSQVR